MSVPLVPFLEVIKDVSGGNAKTPQSEFLEEGVIPVVDQGQKLIAGFVNDRSRLCKTKPPVIVFGDHTRAIKYVDFDFAMGADGIKVLVPRLESDAKYLFYALSAINLPAAGYSRHFKFLKKAAIPLPPLPEQKRIAAILDAADALRAKRREAIAQLDTLAQSVFLDMFGDPVTNPMGWECVTVGEALERGVFEDVQDGNHGERHPKVADFESDGVPFVMANCIGNGELDLNKAYKLPHQWLDKLRVGFARGGDLLLSHKGTIGEVAIVPKDIEVAILSPQVTYYRMHDSINARHLAGMFRSEGYQRLLSKEAQQSTRAYIGITRQKRLPIVIPPIESRRRFSAFAAAVEKQKAAQRSHLAELDTLFASLQSRAFRGDL